MHLRDLAGVVAVGALAASLPACDSGSDSAGGSRSPSSATTQSGATDGATTGSGAGATTSGVGGSSSASSGTGGQTMPGASDLPVPPGGGVPKPSGAAGNLQVLPWAGFEAAVTYTFDDAQPSHIEHWPELVATGARTTLYINTSAKDSQQGFDETWKDAVAKGHEVANHTVHHCNFNAACGGAPAGSADAEIDGVTEYIQTTLGQPTWTMAYPFGDTGYEPAAKARFCLARGVGGGMVAPSDDTDPWNLPVFAAGGGEAAAVFSGSIDSAHDQGRWVIFLFHSILPTDQNWYAGVDIGSITGSIGHAQSMPDVWVDSLIRVGAYWLGQRTLEGAMASMSSGTTTWTWTVPEHFPPGRYVRVTVDGGSLAQGSETLVWDDHGYYEVALDAGSLVLSP